MTPKRYRLCMLIGALLAAATGSRASTIIGALEDGQGSSGLEKSGDFNDVIFQISGVTIDAPGAAFSSLTSSVVNQNGTVFWDNLSGDGPNYNIGFCLLGAATCAPAGVLTGSYEYLANPNGSSPDNVTFGAAGTVTITVLGGVTQNRGNTLGWYDLDNPGVVYSLFAVPANSTGETATFTPDGAFALVSTDGFGQVYSSVSAANILESPNQQHFAFFEQTQGAVPEPSTLATVGLGLALLSVGTFSRRRSRRRDTEAHFAYADSPSVEFQRPDKARSR